MICDDEPLRSSPIAIGKFVVAASPLYRRLIENLQRSRTLAAIRDALLPKLLSWEVRVMDAGKIMEAAV